MKGTFDKAIGALLEHEGGYVNHPSDPGGETNMGISKRSYPDEDIKGMTRERATEIYHEDYWLPAGCNALPLGVDYAVFDQAVNSGQHRSIRWLQRAVGAEADGWLGSKTLAAVEAVASAVIIERMCEDRLHWLKGRDTWSTFGKGWTARVNGVRDTALELIKPQSVKDRLGELEGRVTALEKLVTK